MSPAELRECRTLALCMTQAELAAALKCTPAAVRAWEAGRRPISGPAEVAIGFLLRERGNA